METAEFIETLRREGPLLADAAQRAGLDASVPTCPKWQVRDLLRHTGAVHRWAAGFVAEGRTEPAQLDDTAPSGTGSNGTGSDGGELVDWYRLSHARLVEVLEDAPADLVCWTFMPAPSPLEFWVRRQAHETTVHRVDAQAAAGLAPSAVDPAFAADGVDELMLRFEGKGRDRARSPQPRTLRVRTEDVAGDSGWTLHFTPDPPRWERGGADGGADCEVSAPAAELYLALWNRLPHDHLSLRGDRDVMDLWLSSGAAS
ncbi:maleylpyruvate isomerase family mycothiol-dependent enzyme [Streptomyces sp. NPDC088194]|uniref:maleylpyruvate isomerase family mycothiol-dependent enzyme n=1 Tax=Streptomyces sp. NPDC088194 TaxID=3154931 RepID=UPI00344F10FD